ncbi:trypsin-like cysteine/serine peptidase domain-containing protein [Xylariales sp. PMI_506]|nr:trypsin-like cysteine/serine peptidase domain-containing protein [Xylariales sp. PMI_506]
MLKQERLQESSAAAYLFDVVPKSWSKNPTAQFAVDATLVFGQEEAGTAVCISPDGLLLTCSHCVAEDEQQLDSDWRSGKLHWLLFRSGTAVCAECLAWDPKRDLALMRVVQAQTARRVPLPSSSPSLTSSAPQPPTSSPSAPLIETSPPVGSRVVCIGHPGSQDLEASRPGVQTNYDVLHTSTGRYRGLAAGQDPQDNSEIGALMHDAWTYWGHSGAPLLAWGSGALVGLHSSWDDQTGMRRGVPLVAIREFIEENKRHFSWWPLSG